MDMSIYKSVSEPDFWLLGLLDIGYGSCLEMCNCLFSFKSITKYITKDFNFAQLHHQL